LFFIATVIKNKAFLCLGCCFIYNNGGQFVAQRQQHPAAVRQTTLDVFVLTRGLSLILLKDEQQYSSSISFKKNKLSCCRGYSCGIAPFFMSFRQQALAFYLRLTNF
jgi:hypothetical protein